METSSGIIVLGYGRLGKVLCDIGKYPYLTHEDFDFCAPSSYIEKIENYSTIINCVANTDTYSEDKESMLKVNFIAVCDLVTHCNITGKKLIHISTDHVYANSYKPASEESVPVHTNNWYSYSKLLADGYIESMAIDYLIIRTSFKPTPFPYPRAITTQRGNFDYIDVIGKIIVKLINSGAKGIVNVGTEEKTIYELAIRTNPGIIASDATLAISMPRDVTMALDKQNQLLERIKDEN